MSTRKIKKILVLSMLIMVIGITFSVPAFASDTNVSGAVTTAFGTYMKPQIKAIANNVVIPIADVVVLIILVVKAIMAGASYKRNGGQFEWHLLAVLGGCLIFGVSAPFWVWGMIGW
jgi:hypothetical protein